MQELDCIATLSSWVVTTACKNMHILHICLGRSGQNSSSRRGKTAVQQHTANTNCPDKKGRTNGYLDNVRVSEDLVEHVQLRTKCQRVDEVVLVARGDLHQAGESLERTVGMSLESQRRQNKTNRQTWSDRKSKDHVQRGCARTNRDFCEEPKYMNGLSTLLMTYDNQTTGSVMH